MPESNLKQRVLVTGAYGLIGNLVYARLAAQPERYEPFAMARQARPSARATHPGFVHIPAERLRLADLTDMAAVQRAVEGVDTVVHLAADPDGRSGWESILNNNIIGTQHVFEAARLAGVKRIIYASSNMVVFGYFKDEPYRQLSSWPPRAGAPPVQYTPIHHTMPTRPTTYYACSKVFGEALASMYASVHGISCICLRIGWVVAEDRPPHPSARTIWCSQRDCVQMVERSIWAPEDLRFDIFFVQSNNDQNFVDIQHARDVLGYEPQDRAEDYL